LAALVLGFFPLFFFMGVAICESSVENILTPAVTLVVTSCGRPDLLQRTVESFQRFNTCPIAEAIIVEDGPAGPPPIPCRHITSPRRRGQIACIDDA
jgi:hypothetical protein